MEINKKVIEKITKLQALSASNHLGEVQAAQHQIKRLMTLYDITSEEIENFRAGDKECIQGVIPLNRRRIELKHSLIAGILRKFFFVNVLWQRGHEVGLIIVGQKKDIEIATYLWHYLNRIFEEELKRYRLGCISASTSNGTRLSFFAGLAIGLGDKLERERQQCQQWGLLVVDNKVERANAMDKFNPDTRKSRLSSGCAKDELAYDNGKVAGVNLSINAGIRGGDGASPKEIGGG